MTKLWIIDLGWRYSGSEGTRSNVLGILGPYDSEEAVNAAIDAMFKRQDDQLKSGANLGRNAFEYLVLRGDLVVRGSKPVDNKRVFSLEDV